MRSLAPLLLAGAALLAPGCTRPLFEPERATRPYPTELHRVEMADIQVFREGVHVDLVNATPYTYRDVTVWVNRRYAASIPAIPAGRTTRFSLWEFYDELGQVFNAGGFFRTRRATPVRLVEIEPTDANGMIGLVTIRAEGVD
jgi:hypothetical protein